MFFSFLPLLACLVVAVVPLISPQHQARNLFFKKYPCNVPCHELSMFIHSFSVLTFQSSEDSLPVCSPNSVCNKIDTYGSPWVERQCRCPSENYQCSSSLHSRDGHTIVDRNRQYKVCVCAVLPEKQNRNVRLFSTFSKKTQAQKKLKTQAKFTKTQAKIPKKLKNRQLHLSLDGRKFSNTTIFCLN